MSDISEETEPASDMDLTPNLNDTGPHQRLRNSDVKMYQSPVLVYDLVHVDAPEPNRSLPSSTKISSESPLSRPSYRFTLDANFANLSQDREEEERETDFWRNPKSNSFTPPPSDTLNPLSSNSPYYNPYLMYSTPYTQLPSQPSYPSTIDSPRYSSSSASNVTDPTSPPSDLLSLTSSLNFPHITNRPSPESLKEDAITQPVHSFHRFTKTSSTPNMTQHGVSEHLAPQSTPASVLEPPSHEKTPDQPSPHFTSTMSNLWSFSPRSTDLYSSSLIMPETGLMSNMPDFAAADSLGAHAIQPPISSFPTFDMFDLVSQTTTDSETSKLTSHTFSTHDNSHKSSPHQTILSLFKSPGSSSSWETHPLLNEFPPSVASSSSPSRPSTNSPAARQTYLPVNFPSDSARHSFPSSPAGKTSSFPGPQSETQHTPRTGRHVGMGIPALMLDSIFPQASPNNSQTGSTSLGSHKTTLQQDPPHQNTPQQQHTPSAGIDLSLLHNSISASVQSQVHPKTKQTTQPQPSQITAPSQNSTQNKLTPSLDLANFHTSARSPHGQLNSKTSHTHSNPNLGPSINLIPSQARPIAVQRTPDLADLSSPSIHSQSSSTTNFSYNTQPSATPTTTEVTHLQASE
ncbi:hypothetical protein BLNAU_4942 [Blattamonas nauphoetae]|uniref:Uncharacterized protein n=1 Tax=Blattamonas nauphoetae TaxID=2049346 RepID=A0ABQ9Y8P2_9EUKA|nr:hypothetical protein BLNAU_4942 [Blattamonas nauphoetae]